MTVYHIISDVFSLAVLCYVLILNHRLLRQRHTILLLNQDILDVNRRLLERFCRDVTDEDPDEDPVHRVS